MKLNLLTAVILVTGLTAYADAKPDALKEPDRTCKTGADCVPTCGLGAVSKTWYEAVKDSFQDCMDGCMGWGQAVECVKNKCTVFDSPGKENKRCNTSKYRTIIVPSNK